MVMKRAYQTLGIQAFLAGTVTDVGLLGTKSSESSSEEVSFATAKIEVQLTDASTGNLLKTFIGRSPIFGTRETGENSRSKAVTKALDACLDDILDGILRYMDLLDWTTTIARIDGQNFYINAGRSSGLRIGDTLEVFEPGRNHSPNDEHLPRVDHRQIEGVHQGDGTVWRGCRWRATCARPGLQH